MVLTNFGEYEEFTDKLYFPKVLYYFVSVGSADIHYACYAKNQSRINYNIDIMPTGNTYYIHFT